ncbi:MAG: hypothetical protein WCP19_04740 [Chloroflexota bacterium]
MAVEEVEVGVAVFPVITPGIGAAEKSETNNSELKIFLLIKTAPKLFWQNKNGQKFKFSFRELFFALLSEFSISVLICSDLIETGIGVLVNPIIGIIFVGVGTVE